MCKKINVAVLMLLISLPVLASKKVDYISQLAKDAELRQRCEACKDLWSVAGFLGYLNGTGEACDELNESILKFKKRFDQVKFGLDQLDQASPFYMEAKEMMSDYTKLELEGLFHKVTPILSDKGRACAEALKIITMVRRLQVEE